MSLPVRPQETSPASTRRSSYLDSFLSGWEDLFARAGAFTPLADLEETDEAYLAEIELPGVALEDLSVEVAGGHLTVSGERKEKERVGILRRRTRTTGQFRYDVLLPGEVDDEHVEASLQDGVLTVRVPKPASVRRRRIPVTAGAAK
jgi:HSP20 family protein